MEIIDRICFEKMMKGSTVELIINRLIDREVTTYSLAFALLVVVFMERVGRNSAFALRMPLRKNFSKDLLK